MKIKEITSLLEEWAPIHYQEGYDNSGLLVGSHDKEIDSVLISLDCTEDVVQEAIEVGAGMVIAHHPIIFSGLKRLNGSNYIERTIIKAIEAGVAIYAIHTNLDNVKSGVNKRICDILKLDNLEILSPKRDDIEIGSGMMGSLNRPMSTHEFLEFVKNSFDCGSVRFTKVLNDQVQKIAVCGGSGSFLLSDAIAKNADVFLSSDFKYHQFFDAEDKLMIVDIGHYEAEKFTKDLIFEFLTEKLPTFTLHFSKVNTNPINYL